MLRSIQRVNQLSVFLKHSQLTTVGLSSLAWSWFPKLPGTAGKHTVNHAPAQTWYFFPKTWLFWASKKSKKSNQTLFDKVSVSNWSINGMYTVKYFILIWSSLGYTCGIAKWVKWLFTVFAGTSSQLPKILYSLRRIHVISFKFLHFRPHQVNFLLRQTSQHW